MPMTTIFTPEVVKGVIGVSSALAGYAFREYQNRVIPFFQIYKIEGGSIAGWERVSIPEDQLNDLHDTFYIKKPDAELSFVEAYKYWDRCDDVKRFWPQTSDLIQRVLDSGDDMELEESIYELLNSKWFDGWLTRMVSRSDISFELSNENLPKKVDVIVDYEDAENNGVIWFNSSFGATAFGQQLKNPAMNQRYLGFVSNLEKLDSNLLKSKLNIFKTILEKEYRASIKVHEKLKAILEECSRWQFRIAFSNLSNNPAVIEKDATIVVKDKKTNTTYPLECSLAKISVDKGKETVSHSNAPISIKAGETIEFAVVSIKTQKEHELGEDIRTVFKRGTGICKSVLKIQRPGLFSKQKIESKFIEFSEDSNA
jgi:hypothetical protein